MKKYFDIQVNGFAAVDFQDPELPCDALLRAAQALEANSTPKFLLTLVSDHLDSLCMKLRRIEDCCRREAFLAKAIVGYHIEGPWISPEEGYRGAHDPSVICSPSAGDVSMLQNASGGKVRLMTMAPEVPGVIPAIREARSGGIRVALGHTNASMHQIEDAITAGAEFVTHLGNGLPAVLPRHDNALQRLLSWDELTVFLIPDGHHLPPFVLKNIFRAKAFGTALFTTDCMAAAGAPPGDHVVAGIHVHVGEDRVVRDPRTGLFAGSALTMPEAAQNIHAWLGLGEEQAALLCGDLVANALGIPF